MHALITAIEYALPQEVLTTEKLASIFPEWRAHEIDRKTGIGRRHIAAVGELASDLALTAANMIFRKGLCERSEVDYLMLCTQSPDHVLPATACLLQNRLGLPTSTAAIDYNIGCSGYVYGLGLCEGLIVSGQARTILLITADTYSKYLHPADKGSRAIFGDGAAATLIRAEVSREPTIGPFVYGTDGRGAEHLICSGRNFATAQPGLGSAHTKDPMSSTSGYLSMHGPKVFQFAIEEIPAAVAALLRKAELDVDEVDLFVFHQANAYILEELRTILGIAEAKFYINLEDTGNTVSSTIPIALSKAAQNYKLHEGSIVMAVGFGVGFSWSAAIIRWSPLREVQSVNTQDIPQ